MTRPLKKGYRVMVGIWDVKRGLEEKPDPCGRYSKNRNTCTRNSREMQRIASGYSFA